MQVNLKYEGPLYIMDLRGSGNQNVVVRVFTHKPTTCLEVQPEDRVEKPASHTIWLWHCTSVPLNILYAM